MSEWSGEVGLKMRFCEAKALVDSPEARQPRASWITGFHDTKEAWEKICAAEDCDDLVSNVTVIFEKVSNV